MVGRNNIQIFPNTVNSMNTRTFSEKFYGSGANCMAWELNRDFLLFTAGMNKGQDLIITSHGDYLPYNGEFSLPPGIALTVLGPHNHALLDPSLNSMLTGTIKPYATVTKNNVAFHDVNRDYSVRSSIVSNVRKQPFIDFQQTLKSVTGTNKKGKFRNYSLYKYELDTENEYHGIREFVELNYLGALRNSSFYTKRTFDILSVRNRRTRFIPPTLKEAINALMTKNIYYERIILCFCRCSGNPLAKETDNYKSL